MLTSNAVRKVITDDLDTLLNSLPVNIARTLRQKEDLSELLEIVIDLGRLPTARFLNHEDVLSQEDITQADLDYVTARVGDFGLDNRAGIERTLHRISAMRNRKGKTVGLTCRVGRAVFGTIKVIEDLVGSGKSVLLLGRPGVGKTTMLREVARVLADEINKRVVVVDTSNEIAGDGDIPHPGIGKARRMQVPTPALQHEVMIEAVENHMPEVIIIDEIGREVETQAARTIAERGVQLVATAHGNSLDNLINNPTLADLVGGIQSVTLGDDEARRRGTQKSILERKAPPTFEAVVEIQAWNRVMVHSDVAETVDSLLRGNVLPPEERSLDEQGQLHITRPAPVFGGSFGGMRQGGPTSMGRTAFGSGRGDSAMGSGRGTGSGRGAATGRPMGRGTMSAGRGPMAAGHDAMSTMPAPTPTGSGVLRVYLFGVNRGRAEQVIRDTRLPIEITDNLREAQAVLTTKAHYRNRPATLMQAENSSTPVIVLRKNTEVQIEQSLTSLAGSRGIQPPVQEALSEAENAVERLRGSGDDSVDLSPQSAYVRRLQHEIASRAKMDSRSSGREPMRRVRLYRT